MQINHNIPALRALNSLNRVNSTADKHMRNLSSGLRINTAADDAAGMAISNKMRTQVRGLERATMNSEDGISLVQTAEGALNEVHSMLQRMRELAVQGANGTLEAADRRAIQMEVEQLKEEITSTANLTEFNKLSLLDGQLDRRSFTNDNANSISAYISDTVEPGDYIYDITSAGTKVTTDTMGAAPTGSTAIAEEGIININGEEVKITADMTEDEVFAAIRDLAETVDLDLTTSGGDMVLTAKEAGSKHTIKIFSDNPDLLTAAGLQLFDSTTLPATDPKVGKDAVVVLDTGSSFGSTATAQVDGNRVTITDANYKKIIIDIQDTLPAAGATDQKLSVLDAGPLQLQVGANEGMKIEIQIPKLTSTALGLDYINMRTADGAGEAITLCDTAIAEISAVRSKLGAYQNRLEYTINNLNTTTENTTAALSRIEDADMAYEMAEYTQKNVISQAGISMLSQANQRPQQVLQLLQ